MTKKITILGLLGLILGLSACSGAGSTPSGEDSIEALPAQTESIKRTTDPEIAVANLDALIAGMDRQLAISSDISTRKRFFELMALRVQLLGSFSDLASMKALASSNLKGQREEEQLFFARYQLMIHEFSSVQEVLDRLPNEGAASQDLRRTLDLALLQNLDFWLENTREEVSELPQFESYVNLAFVQAALGLFEEADESYEKAEESYADVSPFPLAWLAFQRGLMWSESAGRGDLGQKYYRRALQHLPQFAVANVHLAELVLESDPTEALFLYERAGQGEDPEPFGKLAGFLKDTEPEQALAFQRQATQTYDELLAAYPLAFADHGAEFFSGPGEDPARGVELALQNLGNRKTPRAFLVALGAAEAADDTELLCDLASQALPFHGPHPVLQERLEGLSGTCGLGN